MNVAYVALGANIGDRTHYLRKALEEINRVPTMRITSVSSIYETEPVGFDTDAYFLNMAIALETDEHAEGLLAKLQGIEQQLDRVRNNERYSSRTIDLDILLFNEENIEKNALCIPHPRMHERAFVLAPMSEIAPNVKMPTTGRSLKQIMDAMPERLKKGVLLWRRQGQAEEFGLFES
ncbi:2-amino-4-hydroxy-6-hydroxymethyldihydropteridine diphosphokinase [Natribacillus halophilus]|uniref:2-amino-4-hydroxy-6-hydroxymethyldihydropteridine diphosphokinase n=1 Tax=Natribacillus halophilus TaxID=549003 RepID=A0A1G8RJ04_9BACI|nr:2-amino-4-hydroxy-6-hydroxymethyldihydropteridine diphosphokinase [Natribacillus halophilus]SDJ16360.1 2-amino-4-hydroxy-6-hydroxymethyldihydropteridinediphosphokinase [Natribacillus halophilus]